MYAACQWAVLIILARLGSPEIVGQFSLALAITAPITLFFGLKLRAVQATDARLEFAFGDYMALRLCTVAISLAITCAVIVVIGPSKGVATVIAIVAIAKAAEMMSDLFYGSMQYHEQMNLIAISMSVKGLLSVLAVGAAMWFTGSLVWGAASLAIVWTVVMIAYDARIARQIQERDGGLFLPAWNWRNITRLTKLTLPLGVLVLLSTLSTSVPRYFLQGANGARNVGVFSALAYLIVGSQLIINALGQSASPRLAKHYAAGEMDRFRSLLLMLLAGGALLGAAGILVAAIGGHFILSLIYGPEYAVETKAFTWVMVDAAVGYAYVFLGTGVTAMRRFGVQMPIHAASLLVLIALCAILVEPYGIEGAVWAMLGSGLVEALAYVVMMQSLIFRRPTDVALLSRTGKSQ